MQFKLIFAIVLLGYLLCVPSTHINDVAAAMCMALLLLVSFGVDLTEGEHN